MRSFALVVAGGTLGTLLRFGVGETLDDGRLFPLATFLVNVVGAFALGLLLASPGSGKPDGTLRLLLGTGFLGGFTTYSALAADSSVLLIEGNALVGVLYAVGSVVLGFLASWGGIVLARRIGGGRS